MELLAHLLLGFLITLLVLAAITFGFAMLGIIMAAAIVVAAWVVIRDGWRRWRLDRSTGETAQIIEVEYTDVTDKKGE